MSLELPKGRVKMVLDTDTYNEIDDQFALVYAVIAQDKIDLQAVYAAPFHNGRCNGAGEGMELSYQEIIRVLTHLDFPYDSLVYRGSTSFMGPNKQPIESEATKHLIELAGKLPEGEFLYVAAIGAITNIASALLLDPTLKDKIVVVWLGGHPHYWRHNREFNLTQDPYSAQVVFDSGVSVVHVPCKNVAEHVKTTIPEMKTLFGGRGEIGDYLLRIFSEYEYCNDPFGWSKEIWDIATIAWIVNPDMMPSEITPTPILNANKDRTWSFDENRHPYRVCINARRDAIFRDFAQRLNTYLGSN